MPSKVLWGQAMEVGLAEAARLLGISEATVRRRVHNGELPGKQIPTRQGFVWMVEVDDDLAPDNPDPGALAAMKGLVTSLNEQLLLLKAQVSAQQEQLSAKDSSWSLRTARPSSTTGA